MSDLQRVPVPTVAGRSHKVSGRLAVPLMVMLLFLVPASAPGQQPGEAPKGGNAASGNSENGKKIFQTYGCYACHGMEGQGATQTSAPRLSRTQLGLAAFVQYVRQPKNQMPPYTAKSVSDQELADIYAFLQSLPQTTPRKNIPLLN